MKSIQLIYTILILSIFVIIAQSKGLPEYTTFDVKYTCSTPVVFQLDQCLELCDKWTKVVALPNNTLNNRMAFSIQYYTNETCIQTGIMSTAQRIDCIQNDTVRAGSYLVKCSEDTGSSSNSHSIISSIPIALKFITTILLCLYIIF